MLEDAATFVSCLNSTPTAFVGATCPRFDLHVHGENKMKWLCATSSSNSSVQTGKVITMGGLYGDHLIA